MASAERRAGPGQPVRKAQAEEDEQPGEADEASRTSRLASRRFRLLRSPASLRAGSAASDLAHSLDGQGFDDCAGLIELGLDGAARRLQDLQRSRSSI
jgi:hypothetical protein